jgi:nitrate reductase molybdenum cofactor assembly chaperone NarJ/NarW
MNAVTGLYDTLAKLLAYPQERFRECLRPCRLTLAEHHHEAAEYLQRFTQQIDVMSVADLQELYTQTFDLNPVCSLELGWQLFGDNYSRGEFLVEMRQTLRRLDVPESTELPDHITHVLPAFGRMPAREANRFASRFLLPALEKMLQGLNGKNCPYEEVLEAIRTVVLSPYGAALEPVGDRIPIPSSLPQCDRIGILSHEEVDHG